MIRFSGSPERQSARPLALLVAAPILGMALAACGGGPGTTAPGTASGAPAGGTAGASGAAGSGGAGGRRAPGIRGEIAQVSGDTLQVRTAEGQTGVQFSSSTRVTEQKAATVAAVATGSCVVATGQLDAAGTGITAQNVMVAPATGGTCTDNGFGGGFGDGGRGGGARAGQSGPPSGAATGGASVPARIATAAGTVTAVTPASITISGRLRTFTRGPRASAGTGTPPGTPGASPVVTVSVHLGPQTRYTATAVVAPSALAVGQCVTAIGPANDIGTVTARSITIVPAGPAGCVTGFGRPGSGRRGTAAASPTGTSGV
jgi:hypothetical protein